jgi:dienelactone hydrolase
VDDPAVIASFRKRPVLLRVTAMAATLLMFAVAAAYVAARRYQMPAPMGPYPVGTRILNLTDFSRREEFSNDPAAKRELVVQVWYPAEASHNPVARYQRWSETRVETFYHVLLPTHSREDAPIAARGGPFPVLLFGHRWNGERTQNTELAEDLASHGYVVASVDHPYNSSRVLLANGRVIVGQQAMQGPHGAAATAAQQIDFWNSTLDVWTADDLFVLNALAAEDQDPGAWPRGQLDTNHAGAFGHSFGGAAALRLCGMDARIKAAVNLDGWTFGAMARRTADQAVMIFDEGSARDRRKQLETLPAPGSVDDQMDRADFAAVDAALATGGGYQMYLQRSQHMDFTDQPMLPPLHRGSFTGPIPPDAANSILRSTVLAFFDRQLRGKISTPLQPGQKTFADLTVEQHAPPAAR